MNKLMTEANNILTASYLQYMLYKHNFIKSSTFTVAADDSQVRRKISFYIKSKINRMIKDDTSLNDVISEVNIEYSNITITFNTNFNGWHNANSQHFVRCVSKIFLQNKFSGFVSAELNNNILTIGTRGDFFKSRAHFALPEDFVDEADPFGIPEIDIEQKVENDHTAVLNRHKAGFNDLFVLDGVLKDIFTYYTHAISNLLNPERNAFVSESCSLYDLYIITINSETGNARRNCAAENLEALLQIKSRMDFISIVARKEKIDLSKIIVPIVNPISTYISCYNGREKDFNKETIQEIADFLINFADELDKKYVEKEKEDNNE